MKNLEILIFEGFFLGLAFLGNAKQGIRSRISFSPMIIDLEVVLKEFLYPADLIKTQTI